LILVESERNRHYQAILKSVEDAHAEERPVLVFFKSEAELEEFRKHEYGRRLNGAHEVTEKTANIDFYVNKATEKKAVTFLPKIFGRGLDFVVRDQEVHAKGGVHVIQTFFSDERSEEVQIKGRTARQGKAGSYMMILLDSDVAADLGVKKEDVAAQSKLPTFCGFLDASREAIIAKRLQALKDGRVRAEAQHNISMEFRKTLLGQGSDLGSFYDLLFEASRCVKGSASVARNLDILLVIDTSGSMENFFAQAQQYALKMLDLYYIGQSTNRCGVIQFNNKAIVLNDNVLGVTTCLTDNKEVLTQRINAMRNTCGGTDFTAPMQACSDVFEAETAQSGRGTLIIFQTDGVALADKAALISKNMQDRFNTTVLGVVVGTDSSGPPQVAKLVGDPSGNRSASQLILSINDYDALVEVGGCEVERSV
jgi:hypothetical protein